MKKHLLTNSKSGGGITKLNSNAFTLIELLAIIVILAIIAVITVPIILNIIENSRKGSATDSAYGYKDAVNKYYVSELSKNPDYGVLNGEYTVTNGSLTKVGTSDVLNIETEGTKPTSGSLTYENNKLTGGCLVIDDYAVTFGANGSISSTVKGGCSNPYETKFDGTYTYRGPGSQEFGALNDEWDVFLRNDGTNLEICGVYGSGNEDVVCLVSGNYENDFEDCTNDEPDYDGTGETCIKGYTKAKADEMLSKGASSCSISNYYGLSCSGPIVSSCGVVPSGNVGCYDYSDTGCDVLDNSVLYCDF